MKNQGLILLGLAAVVAGMILFTKNGIRLRAGWNELTYTGPPQTFNQAFASISEYLTMLYAWDDQLEQWRVPVMDEVLPTGFYLAIQVSRDCTWTF